MRYVTKRAEAHAVEEPASIFYEYTLPGKHVCIGVSEINGRYPESGYEIDEEVEGCWYVESGSGTIGIGGEEYRIEPGDVVLVPMKEKFYIQGDQLRLIVASSPPWTREQHSHVN